MQAVNYRTLRAQAFQVWRGWSVHEEVRGGEANPLNFDFMSLS
jgi:hypothetical protein